VTRWLLLLSAFLLIGCMGGYTSPQAITRIEFASIAETEATLQTIQTELRERGFELQPNRQFPESMARDWPDSMKWRDRHEVSLLRRRANGEDFMISLTPFPSLETFDDVPAQSHFPILEVRFVEFRPGGFSPQAHRDYAEVTALLRSKNFRLVTVSEPPATDEAEYRRVTYGGFASVAFWWVVAWVFGAATIGALVNWCLLTGGATLLTRRLTFVAVGVVLVTPLMYPAALASILLPGALWLAFDPVSYVKVMGRMPQSGIASGVLSALAAARLIRDHEPETD
jgi:hypothetical protein